MTQCHCKGRFTITCTIIAALVLIAALQSRATRHYAFIGSVFAIPGLALAYAGIACHVSSNRGTAGSRIVTWVTAGIFPAAGYAGTTRCYAKMATCVFAHSAWTLACAVIAYLVIISGISAASIITCVAAFVFVAAVFARATWYYASAS